MTGDITLTETQAPAKGGRNLGVELFRVFSMYLIVLLHVLGQGGVYPACALLSPSYKAAWFLETIGYCSVNCYALISGYANAKNGFRFRRVISLWLEVLFFTVGTTAVCALIPSIEVSTSDWLLAVFPVTYKEYWYFNAYVLLFAFMPILNKGLASLTAGQYRLTCGFLFVLTAILPKISGSDIFVLGSGYSCMWLMILYVFGAYFRLHGIPKALKWYVTVPAFFLAGFAAWALKMYAETLLRDGVLESSSKSYVLLKGFVSYTSPFMVIMALAALIFFAKIPIRRRIPAVVVTYLGKATFGVFLFHVGSMMWFHWLGGRYRHYAAYPAWKLTLAVLSTTLALYLAFSLVSLFRIGLFRLARVDRGIDFFADRLGRLLSIGPANETVSDGNSSTADSGSRSDAASQDGTDDGTNDGTDGRPGNPQSEQAPDKEMESNRTKT